MTFETESFSMEEIKVLKELKAKILSEINNENLFRLTSQNILIGYAYVSKAPGMKEEFNYIIMFDKGS